MELIEINVDKYSSKLFSGGYSIWADCAYKVAHVLNNDLDTPLSSLECCFGVPHRYIAQTKNIFTSIQKYGYTPTKEDIINVVPNNEKFYFEGTRRLAAIKALGKQCYIVVLKSDAPVIPLRKTGRSFRIRGEWKTMPPLYDETLINMVESTPLLRSTNGTVNLYQPIKHGALKDYYYSRFDTEKRMQLILNEVGYPKDKRFLDIGSHTGYFSIELAKLEAKCTGVEPWGDLLNIAQFMSRYWATPVNWVENTIQKHVESNKEQYDYILFLSVFHHFLKTGLDKAWNILMDISTRAPTMFFEMALSTEQQMKKPPVSELEITEETIPKLIMSHSKYDNYKLLSTGLLRANDDGTGLPIRPLYMFWRN